MIHEFRDLLQAYIEAKRKGLACMLASVVHLDGSSYRRPGVRMLIREDLLSFGAVSGGCVEKEVIRQAKGAFEQGVSKLMLYDGRYRLGCEGQLYILIEPIKLEINQAQNLIDLINKGGFISLHSTFNMDLESQSQSGTIVQAKQEQIKLNPIDLSGSKVFTQDYKPLFRLLIIGVEHDAVTLCKTASALGWQVSILAPPNESNDLSYFKGASAMYSPIYEKIDSNDYSAYDAVVLMTHSFNKDIKYLLALEGISPEYLGILGPSRRKTKVIDQLLELKPDIDIDYLDRILGPIGLDLGAETPQEIALSICSEILKLNRSRTAGALSDKKGRIHD